MGEEGLKMSKKLKKEDSCMTIEETKADKKLREKVEKLSTTDVISIIKIKENLKRKVETLQKRKISKKMLRKFSKYIDEISDFYKIEKEGVMLLDNYFNYDGNMDEECIPLCNAMNSINGIETLECCCGHGKRPFLIIYQADNIQSLFFVARCFDNRYGGGKWNHEISVSDTIKNNLPPTRFMISTTKLKGKEAYKVAEEMVRNINFTINNRSFIKEFGLSDIIKRNKKQRKG